ncbi:MAG: VOC family protein [Vicinamibacterales bacterium]
MAKAKHAVPAGLHTITPQLIFDDAAAAIEWYKKALGAVERFRFVTDGQILHGQLTIGDSTIYVNDAVMGGKSPAALGGTTIGLWLYVENCDAVFTRAIDAGARVSGESGPMQDRFWGDRSGTFTDPHGYTWTIATRKEDLTPEETAQRRESFLAPRASATEAS